MRVKFGIHVYGYVVMPEHVHLLVSEPERETLADAMHYLKLSFTKRLRSDVPTETGPFWQARGYDRNVRNAEEFAVKLGYIHENPVKRGLVTAAGALEVEQFPSLRVSRSGSGGDRVRVDDEGSGSAGGQKVEDFLTGLRMLASPRS